MATAPSPSHENRGYGQFDATVTVDVLSNSPIFVGRCTRKRRGWAAAATEPSASTMCRPERCTSWSTSSTTSGTTSSWTSTTLPSINPLQSPGSRSRLQAGGREGPWPGTSQAGFHPLKDYQESCVSCLHCPPETGTPDWWCLWPSKDTNNYMEGRTTVLSVIWKYIFSLYILDDHNL